MSDDVVDNLRALRDAAAAAAAEDMTTIFDRWANAQEKLNADQYKADDLAADVADGINFWVRMGARNLQMASQVLAIYNAMPPPAAPSPGDET